MKKHIIALVLSFVAIFTAVLGIGCAKSNDPDGGFDQDSVKVTFSQYLNNNDTVKSIKKGQTVPLASFPNITLPQGFEHLTTKWSIDTTTVINSNTTAYAEYYLGEDRVYFVEFALDESKSSIDAIEGYKNLNLPTLDVAKAGQPYSLPDLQALLNIDGDAYWSMGGGDRFGIWWVTNEENVHTFKEVSVVIQNYSYNNHQKFTAVVDDPNDGDWSDIY